MSDTAPASPLDQFTGRIEPTKVSLLYQLGLGFVAFAMVLLPVVYVAFIVGIGWLVLWHLEAHAVADHHTQGRAGAVVVAFYFAPAVVGGILILFLLKPLFSRPAKRPQVFKLAKADEPLLFEFVARICQHVGAPVPREIRLDTQVNASAGFRRGWLSFFGSDLVLVIGLPLVAGMTTRQLAGVLAHEFGHFAQGAGMRLSYIIRSVNLWFARVVFERDHWDEKLADWSSIEDIPNFEVLLVKLPLKLAQGGVWVGRRLLWCLMHLGHAISCFMSRQMEFDADSYEAKLAGSEEFARTAERLRHLGLGHAIAMHDAEETYQSKALPEDLPALVSWREKNLTADNRGEIDKLSAENKTKWWDTHPADADRVKAALAWRAPGIFHHEAPAAELFTDFSATSRAVTRHFFEHILEISLEKVSLRNAEGVEQERQVSDTFKQNLTAFYDKNFHPLRIKPIELEASGAWREARAQMQALSKTYGHQLEHLERQQNRQLNQIIGRDLIAAGFVVSEPGQFFLTSGSKNGADLALQQTQRELQKVYGMMSGYEGGGARRLSAALGCWRSRQADEAAVQNFDRLLAAQRLLAGMVPGLMLTSCTLHSLQVILGNAQHHSNGAELKRQALALVQRIDTAYNECKAALGELPHPYLPDHPPVSHSMVLPDKLENEWDGAAQQIHVFTEVIVPLFIRIMGDLCGLALEAEKEDYVGTASPVPAGADAAAA
ncbi:M48 family metallopeptidase [Prosthecobacter sp.]|uniref:M48 family metallopeptidase n=1 Tax=Prosthecobacter sp. TaxID=1965333 RepID=UPI0037831893